MNVNKDVKYTIEASQNDYDALVYMARIMVKVIDCIDDSVLLNNLKIDLEELESRQDILYEVAENIQFSH